MTAPRRALPTSGRFQPRVGTRGIDPVDALITDLIDLADELDQKTHLAGGPDRSTLAREFHEIAGQVRAIVKEHQS